MNSKILNFAGVLAIWLSFVLVFSATEMFGQKTKSKTVIGKSTATKKVAPAIDPNLPKVTQIDAVALKDLFKREGENQKPLLINFWATWCGPCVEEFPDLVKINNDYKGKIDFITITLDDVEDLNTGVPKFLGRMNATMPTYLLKTADEGETISAVYKDWQGGLPFTIFFDGKGAMIYNRQGKIVVSALRDELEKITSLSPK